MARSRASCHAISCCGREMKDASLSRVLIHLLAVGIFSCSHLCNSQQPPSPDKSSAPDAADGADARRQFSQSLAQSKAMSDTHPREAQLSLQAGLLRERSKSSSTRLRSSPILLKPTTTSASHCSRIPELFPHGRMHLHNSRRQRRRGPITPRHEEWPGSPISSPATQAKPQQS